jgi:hypothetical protein
MRKNSTQRGFLKTAGPSLGIAPLAESLVGCSISKSSVTLRTTENVYINNCSFADSIFSFIASGNETSGGVRHVKIEHCKFIKAQTRQGCLYRRYCL